MFDFLLHLIIFICIILIITIDLQRGHVEFYADNGVRMNMAVSMAEWDKIKNQQTIDCDTTQLVKCKLSSMNFDCFNCKQTLSSCVNFEQDEVLYDNHNTPIGTIPKNSDGEGYCIRINGKNERKCTLKNGGEWLLIKDQETSRYAYICYCTTPSIFTNRTVLGDCDDFKGCVNGNISNADFDDIKDITCNCDAGYVPTKLGAYPTCKRSNLFEYPDSTFTSLGREYISDTYSGRNLSLPNPCIVDAITNKVVLGVSRVVLTKGIAHCESLNDRYTTITFDDDYLINNGGRYSNGIVSIVKSDAKSLGDVFETSTRRGKGSEEFYPHFIGKRFSIADLTIELPYLDSSSMNMGGGGRQFHQFAYITNKATAKIYIYNSESPKNSSMPVGLFNHYMPVFTSGFEASEKYYQGTIPFPHAAPARCNILQYINLAKGISNKYPAWSVNGIVYIGKNDAWTHPTLVPRYVGSTFCNNGNKVQVNEYSKVFTGIYMNYTIGSILYTKVLSPGYVLVNQYRKQVDNEWRQNKNITDGLWINREPVWARNDLNAGEISDGFDCNNTTSMPSALDGRYTCTPSTFKWSDQFKS